ncbi:MAG: carotenoid biosynthesis protein [Verrucomicrobiota bacterium]
MRFWSKIERASFFAYLFWISIGLVSMSMQWTELRIAEWEIFQENKLHGLRWFIGICLRNGNPVLMILAALNVYFMMVRHWGLSLARRWSLMVMIISGMVEVMGTRTGYPFGAYHYTEEMGPRIGGLLPISIPFAWLVVVSCGLIGLKCCFPMGNQIRSAVGVGIIATIFDYLMEPFASRAMAYWIWETPTALPPWQNYLAWFGLSFFLVWRYATMRVDDTCSDIRPPVILGSMLTLFVVVRMVHGI